MPESDGMRRFKADWRTCIKSESAEAQLEACTRLIVSDWVKDSSLPDVYNNRGVAYWRLDQFERAIADYDRCLELNPRHVDAYVNRGNSRAFLKQFDAAIRDYVVASTLDPSHPLVYTNLGNAHWEKGDVVNALNLYEVAARVAPNEVLPHFQRGRLLMHLKRYEEAIADFDRILQIDGRHAPALYQRGVSWQRRGNDVRAAADFAAARAIDPTIDKK
jgi:tetratricopeptide (TPR) repeat protein